MGAGLAGYLCCSKEVVGGPASEPVTDVEAKAHLKVDYADEDTFILSLIKVCRETVEEWCNRSLINTTWKAYYEGLGPLVLPRAKVSAVTHVKYYGSDGSTNTVTSTVYESDLVIEPAYITTAYGQQWPTFTPRSTRPVEVQFVAGYGANASFVPATIKHAILMMIGHYFRNRENVLSGNNTLIATSVVVPLGAQRLLDNFRVRGCE